MTFRRNVVTKTDQSLRSLHFSGTEKSFAHRTSENYSLRIIEFNVSGSIYVINSEKITLKSM